jgi:hypothetical protein
MRGLVKSSKVTVLEPSINIADLLPGTYVVKANVSGVLKSNVFIKK